MVRMPALFLRGSLFLLFCSIIVAAKQRGVEHVKDLLTRRTEQLPLYRISREFLRNDIHISKQVMSNWLICIC